MKIEREIAARLNPLVDERDSQETLGNIRDVLFLLEDINAQSLEICTESNRAIFHIYYLIQHAIDFEIAEPRR